MEAITIVEFQENNEALLDALADFYENLTDENFDGNRLDSLLEALNQGQPEPNTEAALSEFHQKFQLGFEKFEPERSMERSRQGAARQHVPWQFSAVTAAGSIS